MTTKTRLITNLLFGSARLASKTAPLSDRLFRETLAIDDNRSYWVAQTGDYAPEPPLTTDISADLAVIGGGFTGVSTAYHFSRRYPEKRVVLLEAKTLANGASGRNGGMMLNWLPLEVRTGPEMDRRIYAATNHGIDTIDFGRGDGAFKLLFADRQVELCEGAVARPGSLAKFVRQGTQSLVSAAERLPLGRYSSYPRRAAAKFVTGVALPGMGAKETEGRAL